MAMAAETIKLHIRTHTYTTQVRADVSGELRSRSSWDSLTVVTAFRLPSSSGQRCRADAEKWEKSLFYVPSG